MSFYIGECGHLNEIGDGPGLVVVDFCTRCERQARRAGKTAGTEDPGRLFPADDTR